MDNGQSLSLGWEIASLVAGLTALPAALTVGYLQIRDYFGRLRVDVTGYGLQKASEDTYLLLLRVSFLNRSSVGILVYDYDVEADKRGTATISECERDIQLETGKLIYRPSKSVDLKMPISESLLPPLHIPPRQSLSKWIPVVVSNVEPHQMPQQMLLLRVDVFGLAKGRRLKKLDHCLQAVPLQQQGFFDTRKKNLRE